MNNILFDTQYGNNTKIVSSIIPPNTQILVYYGGSVDYSMLKQFPQLKLVVGHNVMLDLDDINDAIKEYDASFLQEHLFISDRAFVSLPINKRAKSAYDNKYFGTGYRVVDLHEIRDTEDVQYIERNKNILNYTGNLSRFLEKNSDNNILFLNTDGAFYDIDTGIYPDVMPYSTMAAGAFETGLAPKTVDNIIGIVRAYALYSGKEIMPTEYADSVPLTSTKRIGRLDLVALKEVCKINSITSLVLTDLWELDDWDKIQVCTEYADLDFYPTQLDRIIPIYETIEGWKCSTVGVTSINHLPLGARELIGLIESYCEVMVDYIDTNTACIKRWDYWS